MKSFIFPENDVKGTMDQFPITGKFVMDTVTSYESMGFIIYGQDGVDEEGVDETYVKAYHADLDALPFSTLLDTIEKFHSPELNYWEAEMIDGLAYSISRKVAAPGEHMEMDVYFGWEDNKSVEALRLAVSRFEATQESDAHCAVLEGAL